MKNENKPKFFPNNKIREKTKWSEKSRGNDDNAILSDPRFAHIASDPRYRNISQKATKIQIDRRFKDALMNERFNVKPTLDPRGRPKSYGTKEGLSKFYDLRSSEDESEDESDDYDESDTSDSSEDEEDEIQRSPENSRKSIKTDSEESKRNFMVSLLGPERDLARGDNFYSDDSSDDDSSTTDEDEDQEEEFKDFEWGELDADAQWDVDGNEVEETNRFAVCDMDWDKVKAVDLFVLFSSFVPTGSCLKKVIIYPSEFGKARLAKEEVSGPQELIKLASFSSNGKYKDDFSNLEKIKKGTLNENDCASELELEALRRYQRNRLKYYYAVVECDTVETAKAIYKECDRSYFEVIGVTLDLRYIPSDMEFDEVPHDACEKIPASYASENFEGTALCHTRPVLTWDETDKRRQKVLQNTMDKALKKQNFDDNILNDFVAVSGSDEDEEDDCEVEGDESSDDDNDTVSMEGQTNGRKKEDRIAKFRALISEIDEKERKKQESTFTLDEEEAFAAGHERDSEEETEERDGGGDDDSSSSDDTKSNEESVDDEFKNLTPFERMLMKREKKKKERKRMIKKLKENKKKYGECGNDESEDDQHVINSSQKKVAKKKKKKNIENEDVPQTSNDDLALLVMDEEQEEKRHFDMVKIKEQKEKMMKKKRKRNNENGEEIEEEKGDNFEIDTSDSRFSALFTSGDFNMDPSHPKFDKHSSAAKNIMQKQKKMKINLVSENNTNSNNNDERFSKVDSNISEMIRKFKMKNSKLN